MSVEFDERSVLWVLVWSEILSHQSACNSSIPNLECSKYRNQALIKQKSARRVTTNMSKPRTNKKPKPTSNFACSSLTRKTPVQDRCSLLYLHNVRPLPIPETCFIVPHLTVETPGQKLCVERSADHDINHGILNRSNKKNGIARVLHFCGAERMHAARACWRERWHCWDRVKG